MKNSETFERYEIEYQNADYYGEYKYADLLSKLSNLATKNAMEIGLWKESFKLLPPAWKELDIIP